MSDSKLNITFPLGTVVRKPNGRYGIVSDFYICDDLREFPEDKYARVTSDEGSGIIALPLLEPAHIDDDPNPVVAAIAESTADGSTAVMVVPFPMDVLSFGRMLAAVAEIFPDARMGSHSYGTTCAVIVQ